MATDISGLIFNICCSPRNLSNSFGSFPTSEISVEGEIPPTFSFSVPVEVFLFSTEFSDHPRSVPGVSRGGTWSPKTGATRVFPRSNAERGA